MRMHHGRGCRWIGRIASLLSVLLLITAATLPATMDTAFAADDAKKSVESVSDLPTHTYDVGETASALLEDDARFDALVAAVHEDLKSTLDEYDIQDSATLQRYYGMLANIALLEERHDDALEWLEKSRALETKEAQRLTSGLVAKALVHARENHDEDTPEFAEAFHDHYEKSVRALPWDTVQDQLQSAKGRLEMFSPKLVQGIVQGRIDPVVANTGELTLDLAGQIIGMRMYVDHLLPLKEQQMAVLSAVIAEHREEKEDIWPERSVTLDASRDLQPVVVGIWDSGVDPVVFGDRMYTNPEEKLNGVDDDGNGFVDDIHGIAFDVFGNVHPELLHPHGDQTGQVQESIRYVKGITDLQAAIDSEEASEIKRMLGSLEPEQVQDFIDALGFTAIYTHGTHVAGIAARGNPFARILPVRITFDYHSPPLPVTEDMARRHAESYARAADYFRAADARVVNMSWGWSFEEVRSSLEANGIGADAEERKQMADRIFGILSEGLHDALASCPDILFVSAAGNEDADVEFDRFIPSAYDDLDNLLVVGAVDQAGERTSFTSMGENVVVYANGFEVESSLPGGDEMAMSGTSMASPNVANLAAKVVAVQPGLQPTEIIRVIEDNADSLEEQPELKLINPRATLEALEKSASR